METDTRLKRATERLQGAEREFNDCTAAIDAATKDFSQSAHTLRAALNEFVAALVAAAKED